MQVRLVAKLAFPIHVIASFATHNQTEVHIVDHDASTFSIAAIGGAQAVDRSMALLGLVARHPDQGITLSDLVAVSGLNKPTVRRILLALIRAGMVEQNDQTRRYYLGQEAYLLGTLASRRHGFLDIATEAAIRLARDTGDASFVSVRRGSSSLCMHREDGAYPIRTYALIAGQAHPLGIGAGSLAMLATLPDDEMTVVLATNRAVIDRDFPTLTMDEINSHIAQTRTNGFSVNPGLIFSDSWGIGMVFRQPDGTVAGALSIAAVENRMQSTRRDELVAQLRAAVADVETQIAERYAARSRI
jgi:DNA-binding IclR family transcriptional regulator